MTDVIKAVEFHGKIPTFQRFPILIKPSEAERNYVGADAAAGAGSVDGAAGLTATPGATVSPAAPIALSTTDTGKSVVQNVYVGSIDRLVTQAQLFAIFSQFGELTNLHLPIDPATGLHRGYAFLSYTDPKHASLAIKIMAGQPIAGRQL